jgi:Holliday junction DNA helicase RuvB
MVDIDETKNALEMYEVDQVGLDRLDKSVLVALVSKFNGGPVGLSTLAMAIGEEAETIENLAEPFLVRMGFLSRTPRGRVATAAGYQHLGEKAPIHLFGGDSLFDTPAQDA